MAISAEAQRLIDLKDKRDRRGKEQAATPKTSTPAVSMVTPETASTLKSVGRTQAYSTRRLGGEWPGAGWSSDPNTFKSMPGYERVRITIEPVEPVEPV